MSADFLTAKEIAKIIPFSARVVAERITKLKDFPSAIRIGNRRFWPRSEIEKWIESRREK